MGLNKTKKITEVEHIGRVLLEEFGIPHLEAFSENALYCLRGMPTMNKYKTVKEVCDLTGLTRKHLYYFHHEKVVQPAAYANYSVDGYSGYKLYDELAVEKLQQIALYYQLGLKRNDIKNIMLAPNYDSNMTLHDLLKTQREKKTHIERHIAALEFLIQVGIKNRAVISLSGISLDDLGRTLLAVRDAAADGHSSQPMAADRAETFAKEFSVLVRELARIDMADPHFKPGDNVIKKIFNLSDRYLGSGSPAFVLGLFMSVLGEGSVAQDITDRLTPAHGSAVIQYIIDHPQIIPGYRNNKTTDE